MKYIDTQKKKNPEKIKMGKRNREKGQEYERLICKIINDYLDTCFQRTPGSGGMHLKGDILNTGNKSLMNTIHFEVKNVEKISIQKWLKQSYQDAPVGKMPTVISKLPRVFDTEDNFRKKIQHIITMDLMDFLCLIKIIDETGVKCEITKTEVSKDTGQEKQDTEKKADILRKLSKKYEKENREIKKRYDKNSKQYKERAKAVRNKRKRDIRSAIKLEGKGR